MCCSQVHSQPAMPTRVTVARSGAGAGTEQSCKQFGKAALDAVDCLYFQWFSFKESNSLVQSRLKWRLLISERIMRTGQVKRIVHRGVYFCFNSALSEQFKLKSEQAWGLHFIMVKGSAVPLGSDQLPPFVFNSSCLCERDNMAHNEWNCLNSAYASSKWILWSCTGITEFWDVWGRKEPLEII